MSEAALTAWSVKPFSQLAEARRGITYSSAMLKSEEGGLPYINMKSFLKGGGFNVDGTKHYAGTFTQQDIVGERDLLIANTDVTSGDIIGVPALLPEMLAAEQVLYSHHVTRLRINGEISVPFLYYLLCLPEYRSQMLRIARGTTVLMLDMPAIKRITIRAPKNKTEQSRIVEILSTVDKAIEKTEALIAKYQRIKAGLMHDLFTHGVTADGKLRPPREQAPELYQETPIGWIPKEWKFKSLSYALESVVDGPFGSNLKTEHYVVDPGIRVVRLQNVAEFEYNDNDKAYISERHASYLLRNKVVGGDVLIAGLGEERYPVGRACCYPDDIAPAINKADCFRARCNPDIMKNRFFMLFLNSGVARRQVRRYEQGVTRPRINTTNLKRLNIGVPDLDEQVQIVAKFDAVQSVIQIEQDKAAKLREQKLGLMHDLLTGSVRVLEDIQPATMVL